MIERVGQTPERVSAILQEHAEALLAFDAGRAIVAANDAARRFFRDERDALVGQSTDLLVPVRLRQPNAPPPLATRELTTVELPALRRDGSEVVVVWTFGAAATTNGPLFLLLVRERAKMLAELETVAYAVLFEQSPFPLSLTRLSDGITVALNQAFADLFELDRQAVIGKRSVDFGVSTEAERAVVARIFEAHGAVQNFECERRTTRGKPLHVLMDLTPVKIAGVDHVLATVQDISLRKAQETALAQAMQHEKDARAEAEAASRAKDDFFATMSHELRTPLNAILGWATMLQQTPRNEAKLNHGLKVIERNARAQERLVSELLDTSRIISGKLALTRTRTSAWEITNAAADVIRPAAEAKGVRLIIDVDPDLPLLVGDVARLQQVLGNLLSNAVRYTPRGGRITVTADRSASSVRIRVHDTGEGIDPDHLPRIFERFRQVDTSTTRGAGGLGLGLAIVRQLVEAHGGSTEAHSDGPGCGSTFTVTLPVPAIDVSQAPFSQPPLGLVDDEAASSPSDQLPTKIELNGLRILIVDDEHDSLDLVSHVLEAAGAKVTAVSSARAALMERGPFDVIVSDVGMPEMDGHALIRDLRARGSAVPAIALTAYVSSADAERATGAGFHEHVAKPIDAATLIETVHRWARASCQPS
ncbi:MAG: ATP-binding protein [Myxococcales bacterium]